MRIHRGCHVPHVNIQGMGGQGGAGQNAGGFSSFMTTFGAVPVTASNFFQLMQQGEAVLLFPGGVREVRHGSILARCTDFFF
jgi:hypothetical protein